MEIIIAGLALTGLILVANTLVVRDKAVEKRLFHWFLFFLNIPLLLAGLALLALPADIEARILVQIGPVIDDLAPIGGIIVLTALWGFLAAAWPVRALVARIMPLNPGSPVHTLALILAGYLVGYSALSLSQGGIEGLADAAAPTSVLLFVFSELIFVLLAFMGVGFVVRRRGRQLAQRLGLVRPQPVHLLIGAGLIAVLVVTQGIAGVLWSLLNPEQAALLEDVNTLLLGNVDTVWEWLILALAAGIGEELLFRGALQPVLGLGFTSALFAVIHIQYGLTPITLFVLFLALVMGLVRRYTNTTTAIFVHAGYDFVLGLLALLLTYLQEFVS